MRQSGQLKRAQHSFRPGGYSQLSAAASGVPARCQQRRDTAAVAERGVAHIGDHDHIALVNYRDQVCAHLLRIGDVYLGGQGHDCGADIGHGEDPFVTGLRGRVFDPTAVR
ncbi:MAG TPA: hypothetical protein VMA72_30965 [Streptosporangiaceae bacterium]|nr:hypothetical protein [Streptosporangiaceae bacterium]